MKGKFFGTFDPTWIDGNMYRLRQHRLHEFGFITDSGISIVPHNGFLTDMFSVPKPFWPVFPKTDAGDTGDSAKASVIHDYLYTYAKLRGRPISRKFADDVFLAGLKALGVQRWRRIFIYGGVRAVGWSCFGNRDKLNKVRSI